MIRYGYACINTELNKQGIKTGRTLKQATFEEKGLDYVGQLALANAKDLLTILKWNLDHGITFFRLGSEIFPRWNHYELKDVPQFDVIADALHRAGDFASDNDIRVTTHPGPYNVLGSPNPDVVDRTIVQLERHSQVFDLMGFEPSYYNKINIHVGATYGDKEGTILRWIDNYQKLSPNLRARLTIENDDKASMYSVQELFNYLHKPLNIPIVFDYHHHQFCTSGLSEQEALYLAHSTWPINITPVVHYSESRREEYNDHKIREQAHSDLIQSVPNTYGFEYLDIMIEAKLKEQSILKLQLNE